MCSAELCISNEGREKGKVTSLTAPPLFMRNPKKKAADVYFCLLLSGQALSFFSAFCKRIPMVGRLILVAVDDYCSGRPQIVKRKKSKWWLNRFCLFLIFL